MSVAGIELEVLDTPGHSSGHIVFLWKGATPWLVFGGDVLFQGGIGRTDFPGGDSDEMYRSLHQRLAKLPDDTILYPGHLYSPEPSATLGETRARNYVFRMRSIEDWRRLQGG